VARKNIRNQCERFEAKRSVERETSSSEGPPPPRSSAPRPSQGRQAFDALFKK
jgi:hypothetical protein